MQVEWLSRKKVDFSRVENLLSESQSSGKFTNYGPCVKSLEDFFAKLLDLPESKSVIATANGTAAFDAITCAIAAEKNLQKVKIRTQSFTFPTSAQCKYPNETKIVDIDHGGALSISDIEAEDDIAVVTTFFGCVPDLEAYTSKCKESGALLILDNAASPLSYFGSEGKNISSYGDAAIISLHHTKPMGFGEGGLAIVDRKFEESVRKVINFGFESQQSSRIRKWSQYASNWRMSDISAAFIRQHAERYLEKVHDIRRLQNDFINNLHGSVKIYPSLHTEKTVLSCIPVLFPAAVDSSYFEAHGIQAKKYYSPLSTSGCPNAIDTFDKILCFPSHEDMSSDEYEYMLNCIHSFMENSHDGI